MNISWLNNLKIHTKFLLIGGIILFFLVGLGSVGVWGVATINDIVDNLDHDQIPEILKVYEAALQLQTTQSNIELALLENDPIRIEKLVAAAKVSKAVVENNLRLYVSAEHPAQEQDLVNSIKTDLFNWSVSVEELIQLALQNNSQSDLAGLERIHQTTYQNLASGMDEVVKINEEETASSSHQAASTFTSVLLVFSGFALVIIIIILWVVLFLSKLINQPLIRMRNAMLALAVGDLTQQANIDHKDELGELAQTYNMTLNALRSLIYQLYSQSQQVMNISTELSLGITSQVAGSSQQASAISEATQTLQELNQTAQQIAQQATSTAAALEHILKQAHLVNQVVEEMAQAQEQGRANVARTVEALLKLRERVDTIEEQQQELVQQSKIINRVISTIDNIAHETHLLALNAALEASGAGEHGERFSVIASEVKQLADSSLLATKEIRKSLEGIVVAVAQSNQSAHEGVREAEQASIEARYSDDALLELSNLSGQVQNAVRSILTYIQETASLATNIGSATQQQQVASQQMVEVMLSIEAVMSQNLVTIRQSEISTNQLSQSARQLERSADAFKLVA